MSVPTHSEGGHTQAAEASAPTPDHASALARLWWLSAVRGLVALTLALAVIVAGRGTARLLTFLGLYWMVGGLITLLFALAIRPRRKPGWLLPPAWQRSWARFSCCYAICWMISYTLTC